MQRLSQVLSEEVTRSTIRLAFAGEYPLALPAGVAALQNLLGYDLIPLPSESVCHVLPHLMELVLDMGIRGELGDDVGDTYEFFTILGGVPPEVLSGRSAPTEPFGTLSVAQREAVLQFLICIQVHGWGGLDEKLVYDGAALWFQSVFTPPSLAAEAVRSGQRGNVE